jgi:GntR family transcriptional regulator/MocR family aminotransferase
MSIPIDTFFLDPKFEGTLQQKIQRMISEGVLVGKVQSRLRSCPRAASLPPI